MSTTKLAAMAAYNFMATMTERYGLQVALDAMIAAAGSACHSIGEEAEFRNACAHAIDFSLQLDGAQKRPAGNFSVVIGHA